MTAWQWLVIALLATAAGQVVFKEASNRRSNPGRVLAICLFAIAPPASFFALRELSLATVYISTAIVQVLIVLVSLALFHERYTYRQWTGFFLILTGITLYNLPKIL